MTGGNLPGRPPRGRLAGVAQIVGFNRGMYAASGAALAGGLVLVWAVPLAWWIEVLVWIALAGVGYLTAASLVVSYWVYDHSDATHWMWLVASGERWPARWVNVHCGFDQSTAVLRDLTAGAADQANPSDLGQARGQDGGQGGKRGRGVSLDVYDPARMTEASIARARSSSMAGAGAAAGTVSGRFDRWPIDDQSVDGIFMLLAAHELREPAQRIALLSEARRTLAPGGQLWLAEHPRDLANFLAFGPGFTHFFSRASWRRDTEAAGLERVEERSRTPFIRLFIAKVPG